MPDFPLSDSDYFASHSKANVIFLETAQSVTTGAASAQSNAVAADTKFVVIVATKAAWVQFGSNPTASVGGAGCIYIPDGGTLPPIVVTGGTTKIAAIQDSAAGKVCIIESQ